MNSNENCVVAYFENDAAADAAVSRLRQWDERVKDVKLGTIGKIFRGEKGVKVDIVHGGLFNRSLRLNETEANIIGNYLTGTLVALAVNADDYEVSMVKSNLEMAGGSVVAFADPYDSDERAQEEAAARDAAAERRYEVARDHLLGGLNMTPGGTP